MGEKVKEIARKKNILHLRARDMMRFVVCALLDSWDELAALVPEDERKKAVASALVEDVLSTCIRFGLFEEARRAALFRAIPGLKVAEVDEVLTIFLERFIPYHAFSRSAPAPGIRDGFYFRDTVRSYPPFAELLQSASDQFRAKVAKEWL